MRTVLAKSLAVGLATFGIANFANAAPEKNFYENLPRTIYKFLDDYSKVHKNLIKHDKNYPTADYFKSVTHIGNIKNVGEMDEITVLNDMNSFAHFAYAWRSFPDDILHFEYRFEKL